MTDQALIGILKMVVKQPSETEWVEFKVNNTNPQQIGEYLSALSNSAALHEKEFGYLIYGVENITHKFVGTNFQPKKEKRGNQELENWLATQLDPRIDFRIHEFQFEEKSFVIFEIDAASGVPVKFKNIAYIRVGSYKNKLKDFPEKERRIWARHKRVTFEKELATGALSENEVIQLLDIPSYYKWAQLGFVPLKLMKKQRREFINFGSTKKQHYEKLSFYGKYTKK